MNWIYLKSMNRKINWNPSIIWNSLIGNIWIFLWTKRRAAKFHAECRHRDLEISVLESISADLTFWLSMTDKHCARKYSGSAAKCEIFEINLRNALRNLRNNLRTIINRPLEWERSLRGFGTLRKNNIFFLNRPLESERSLRGFGTLRKNTFLSWNPLFRQFSSIFGPRH